MDYTVYSFKDAISLTLDKLNYEPNNIEIIKKLINDFVLYGKNNFTNNGAKKYVKEKTRNGIIDEMQKAINIAVSSIDELINKYIDKIFLHKVDINVILEDIKNRSDLEEVSRKIRSISTNSNDDLDFYHKLWNYYSNMFVDTTNPEAYYKVRYNMLEAALNFASINREYAGVLKPLDPTDTNLTEIDAIKIVEEYVYNNEVEKLLEYINNNTKLSGLLLQNLFNYTYYKKEELTPKKELRDLDSELNKFEMQLTKEKLLLQIIETNKLPQGFNLSRNEIIVNLLKNSIYLNIYTNNKKSMDYDERRLYAGEETIDEVTIHNRILTNSSISNNLMINGLNTTKEDIIRYINTLNDKDVYFLVNMYVTSRSSKENRKRLDESSYFGSNEQLHILNLLEDNKLIEELNKNKLTK